MSCKIAVVSQSLVQVVDFRGPKYAETAKSAVRYARPLSDIAPCSTRKESTSTCIRVILYFLYLWRKSRIARGSPTGILDRTANGSSLGGINVESRRCRALTDKNQLYEADWRSFNNAQRAGHP